MFKIMVKQNQGVTNNSVFEYYSNSWTEQQYSYSVFGFFQYQIVFGIRYSAFLNTEQYSVFGIRVFGTPNSIRVFEQLDRIPVRIVSNIFRTKCLVWDKFLYFSLIFSKISYIIRYLVFGIQIVRSNSTILIRFSDFLDTEQYSVFGIRIFSIPYTGIR